VKSKIKEQIRALPAEGMRTITMELLKGFLARVPDVLPLPRGRAAEQRLNARLRGEGLHGCAVDEGDTLPPSPRQSELPDTFQWSARV
jgi:hypothetical protein